MSSTAYQKLLKMKANRRILNLLCMKLMTGDCKLTTAFMAADINGTAVALAERSAAFVSFQWQYSSIPPTQNGHSAPCSLTSADNSAGILQLLPQMQQQLQYLQHLRHLELHK